MAAQIERGESDSVDGEFFRSRMQGWNVLSHAIVFQHMQ